MKKVKFIYGIIGASIVSTLLLMNHVSAVLDWQDEVDVQFTFNPALSVSISEGDIVIPNLGVGTRDDSNEITITVGTNNVAGYQLSATVGNNTTYDTRNLKHDTSATALFSSIDIGSSLAQLTTPSTWGYSTNSGTSYSGLPKYDDTTNVAILNDSDAAGTETTNFLIGAYADQSQLAGDYRNVINFNVVTNPVKDYMQDFTTSQCQALATDAPYTVYDRRDESDYTVRYIQGACWMTQNLRITGTISATDSNFSGNSFNVSAYDLRTEGTDGGACYYSSGGYNNACNHVPDSSDISATGLTAKELGVWYNYASATAGTITGVSNSTEATEDICPKNWSLPNYNTAKLPRSVNSLGNNINEAASSTYVIAFNPVISDLYNNGWFDYTNSGYWWSATVRDENGRYDLFYVDGGLETGSYIDGRVVGMSIRCVHK